MTAIPPGDTPGTPTPIVVYTYDFKLAVVVERTCEHFGYPSEDSAGETQYENTHFRTYDEALEKLRREVSASISLGARARSDARERFDKITMDLADDAERLARVTEEIASRTAARGTG